MCRFGLVLFYFRVGLGCSKAGQYVCVFVLWSWSCNGVCLPVNTVKHNEVEVVLVYCFLGCSWLWSSMYYWTVDYSDFALPFLCCTVMPSETISPFLHCTVVASEVVTICTLLWCRQQTIYSPAGSPHTVPWSPDTAPSLWQGHSSAISLHYHHWAFMLWIKTNLLQTDTPFRSGGRPIPPICKVQLVIQFGSGEKEQHSWPWLAGGVAVGWSRSSY